MNHDEMVQNGCLPWSPRENVADLDVWQEYEVPLAGTFRLGDQPVLFTAVSDTTAHTTVWAYTCLTLSEAEACETVEFNSVDDMKSQVASYFKHRKAVFVLASDLKINKWTPVDIEDDLLASGIVFLQGLVTANSPDPETTLQGKVAEVESVRPDLVGA